MNVLEINEEKFFRAAKKLHKEVTKSTPQKLSESQELLAKLLGFRNLNGVNAYFSSASPVPPKTSSGNYIDDNDTVSNVKWSSLPPEDILKVFEGLGDLSGSMWEMRACELLSSLLRFLSIERKNWCVDDLREMMDLEKMFEIAFRREEISLSSRQILSNFLSSLPGYSRENYMKNVKISQTTQEQHGYLKMQFTFFLNFLESAEKNNLLLLPSTDVGFLNSFKNTWLDQVVKNTSFSSYLLKMSKEFNISQIHLMDFIFYLCSFFDKGRADDGWVFLRGVYKNWHHAVKINEQIKAKMLQK